MELLYSTGIIGAILSVVYYLIQRAKADKVVADLTRKDRTEDAKEIAKLEQEIEDAKINYADARKRLDAERNKPR